MFYKLFGCMHACILHVLSVRLTRVPTYRMLAALKVKDQYQTMLRVGRKSTLEKTTSPGRRRGAETQA